MPEPAKKKQDTAFKVEDTKQFFGPGIFKQEFKDELKHAIEESQPYRWGTIKNLIDDTLLRNVRKEIETEISFTKKETDIYKVFQSGDLANLSGLDWDDLSRLPSLFKLRAALYSQEFRDLISEVTGCGKLSATKTDMSINTYNKGCHLLTHDDVIGSRRVSFILYMPEPGKVWKEHYGGALRLFPALIPNVPKPDYSNKLIPQFNQIAFFTVQPGLSFHDVEEVRVDKQRLSIQGWYHIPQRGEDGFIEGEQEETEARSTLQQLQNKELEEYDFPKELRVPLMDREVKNYELFQEFGEFEMDYLKKFINLKYLDKEEILKLQTQFIESSVVELSEFLNEELSAKLKKDIRKFELVNKLPNNELEVLAPWKIATPPHKWRYLYIDGKQEEELTVEGIKLANEGPQESPNFQLVKKLLQNDGEKELVEVASFFRSIIFKKWLRLVTDLIPLSEQVLVRRFRQGHDFILATKADNREKLGIEPILECTLNLTPSKNWESGEFGGYELCMIDNEDEEDDAAIYKTSKNNDEDVLVNNQACWNKLVLILRDPSILKFIKYVSYNAEGSRWDIACQWNVKPLDEDEEEEEKQE